MRYPAYIVHKRAIQAKPCIERMAQLRFRGEDWEPKEELINDDSASVAEINKSVEIEDARLRRKKKRLIHKIE